MKLLQFPTIETKIRRLDELQARYVALMEIENEIFEEALRITGEGESNGHTQDFLNKPDMTAAELFAELERNPSDRWDSILDDAL